jgi:hypothetical protein
MVKKILHLNLHAKWFNDILALIKLEEYREIKEYWIRRLLDIDYWSYSFNPEEYHYEELSNELKSLCHDSKAKEEIFKEFSIKGFKDYTHIMFSNGFKTDRPQMLVEFNGVDISTGKEEWGAVKDVLYFNIKLGAIVERIRC